MRILFCGINYAPDLIGVPKYNTELCEWLKDNGHEVRVITAPPYYPAWSIPSAYRRWLYRHEIINGVPVTRAPIYVPADPSGAKRLIHHASFALTSAIPAISTTLRWRPDVMFTVAPSLMSCALIAPLARWVRAKSWLHLQDFEVDAAFDLGLLRNKYLRKMMFAMERRILRSFNAVSTISPQMLKRLNDKGIDIQNIRELRNWVDTTKIAPRAGQTKFRNELGVAVTDVLVLYSGSMSNKQGLDLIIETAKDFDKEGSNVQFVLCGDGPYKSKLRELASSMTNVHFLGIQTEDQFAQLLYAADIHIIPQRAEAADLVLPSKLGGILASGRPVITMAAPNTGLAEETANAGLVASPGDARALATAVRTLVDDVELRQKLGKGARRQAVERWDKTSILSSLNRDLKTLVEII
jgi:colanic acid biosynthesis glycosyl transferase WcaI